MNLVEATKLINHPEVQKDAEMLALYEQRRAELVADINADIQKLGLPAMSLKQLLKASPEPSLADTL